MKNRMVLEDHHLKSGDDVPVILADDLQADEQSPDMLGKPGIIRRHHPFDSISTIV